jgi:hypothetical protein
MTPQEKAKELVNKMYGVTDYQAKQSALIAVDEIIEQNNLWINQTGKGTNNYWQEVKQEIEKL